MSAEPCGWPVVGGLADETYRKCFICNDFKPVRQGGVAPTGDIAQPTLRWICNECLKNKVTP